MFYRRVGSEKCVSGRDRALYCGLGLFYFFYLCSKIMIKIGLLPAGLAHKPGPHGLGQIGLCSKSPSPQVWLRPGPDPALLYRIGTWDGGALPALKRAPFPRPDLAAEPREPEVALEPEVSCRPTLTRVETGLTQSCVKRPRSESAVTLWRTLRRLRRLDAWKNDSLKKTRSFLNVWVVVLMSKYIYES
jgi:hypothetical protein